MIKCFLHICISLSEATKVFPYEIHKKCRFYIYMKMLERLLFSILAGVCVYFLFFFMAGQDGFWARGQLQEQSMALSLHKAELEKTRDELMTTRDALHYDSDVIASFAKNLGLVCNNEVLLKINGLPRRNIPAYDIGFVKYGQPIVYISEAVCRTAGICVFFAMFVLLCLIDLKKSKEEKI